MTLKFQGNFIQLLECYKNKKKSKENYGNNSYIEGKMKLSKSHSKVFTTKCQNCLLDMYVYKFFFFSNTKFDNVELLKNTIYVVLILSYYLFLSIRLITKLVLLTQTHWRFH